jgi:vitamin K-dependent gamma-carboxylase-like protein
VSASLLLNRWERFWFEQVPSELFALVRISLGAAGLISLIGFMPIDMFWSPDGIAPLPGAGGVRSYILESGLGPIVGWTIFLALLASFACMTVGFSTRSTVVLCFLGSVFQARWNTLPLTSGHTVLVAVLFCLIWADSGSRLSADEWLRRRRMRSTRNTSELPLETADGPSQPIWPLRLMRAQIAILYAASGLFKLLGPTWRDGSSVYYTTSQNVYGRVFHVYPLPAGLDWTLTLLTYATLLWEISFPLLLLNRLTRTAALALGVGIHLGILATMEVGPFSYVMLATYVAFLDPHRVARFVTRLRSRWYSTQADSLEPA